VEEKTKKGILWTFYSIILFIILQGITENIILKIQRARIASTEIQNGVGTASIFGAGGLLGLAASIILPLIIIYLSIKFSDINKINEFLKPNKFKVNVTAIVVFLVFALVLLKEAGRIALNPIIENIMLVRITQFGLGFMEILFPVIIYYLIICLIYNISRKN
jgi:hypothetical protein